ncbi:hypothetical protein [Chitinophaga sp. RAB17]|uniref:hypothetical protein n=1 Tax=Chitinophaga sp. RAB17 TaxID=3233049 RepID=UPI003F91D244
MRIVMKIINGIFITVILLWTGALALYVFSPIDLLSFQQWEDVKLVGHPHKAVISPVGTPVGIDRDMDDTIDMVRYNKFRESSIFIPGRKTDGAK